MGRKENIIEIMGTVLLLILFICGLSFLVRPTETDECYSQIETFHSMSNNSLEVIVYGSSHAFRGINTSVLHELYGISAYNYSWHWQKINTIKLFVADSLMTQKPRVALIECYTVPLILKDEDMGPEIYYSRYLKNGKAKRTYLKQCFGNNYERYISYYIPIYALHDNWSNLSKTSFSQLKIGNKYKETYGYGESNQITPVEIPDYTRFTQEKLTDEMKCELDEIVALLHENEANVVFFTVPYAGEYNYGEAMKEYADLHSCVYLDLYELMDDVGIDGYTDFMDNGHLNINGATKVANYIGIYLTNNYELTDYRATD